MPRTVPATPAQKKAAATLKKASARVRLRKPTPPPPVDPNKAAAELCRREFSFFVREFWDVIIAEPLIWAPHLDVLCYEIETGFRRVFMRYDEKGRKLGRQPKIADIVINVPPGTSKSSIVSVMAPVWGWINDPTLRFVTGSYAKSLALGLSIKSRDIVNHPRFKLLFPEFRLKEDENNKGNYKTEALGQRYTTSTDSAVTGEHAHIIIIDDPINPKIAASQDQLIKANAWIDGTLSTRKVDKAVTLTILVMQRLATNDPTGHLKSKALKGKPLRHVCLPATISSKVRPAAYRAIYSAEGYLDPVRMPANVLADSKLDLGSAQYAAQFDQVPVPLSGGIWKRWFIEVPDEVFPSPSIMEKFGTDWDLAYTEEQQNSASAYVSAGRIGGKIYIDDLSWDWLEFPALIKWMKTKPRPHYIEAKASGKSAKQVLANQKVTAIEVKVLGGDKVARANMAVPVAESGVVYIRKSLADRLYNDTKQGILRFPKAEFTDLADALAQALQRLDGRSEIIIANENDEAELADDVPGDDLAF